MMNHPNIVKLKEIIRENNILYFVFEYMECNLHDVMKDKATLISEAQFRKLLFQVFHALAYMHRRGYFHRDLKPENLLVTKDVIKIADFGSAREICSRLPYTEYVTTRWYRPPEVLLHSSVYNSAVDMWAMGAIMAELFTFHPLFPGSSEADEIYKICRVIGSPNMNTSSEGLQLADSIRFQFPQFVRSPLSVLIPSASKEAVDLIYSLCSWDPRTRPTALQALRHSFFLPCLYIPPSLCLKTSCAPGSSSIVRPKGVGEHIARRNARHVVFKPKEACPCVNTDFHRETGDGWRLDMNNLVSLFVAF
ncbi:cyclin-dependent kinase F-4-like [Tasmannia lanceolata]|uniref:cyclin-dependent kinase F-4-like n=1 Tax=Tasmannia lanceolata TaxID=3420 RepID=UPI004063B819